MPKKILVVDDDETVRNILADFLSSQGLQVFQAGNGLRGLDVAEKEKPDIVLLDLIMPHITGIETLKRIKAKFPEMVVVILSGNQEEGTARDAVKLGAYDYLSKPVSLDRLGGLMEQILG